MERVPPFVLYETIEAISVANNLPSPDAIQFGDELQLPQRLPSVLSSMPPPPRLRRPALDRAGGWSSMIDLMASL